MANISTSIENWSTTAASNQPDSADTFTVVDDLRALQAAVRREFASTTIASAGTMNIGAAAAAYLAVSGNTTITAFDTVAAGIERTLKFDGALTLTHNGTSLILPGAANITTAAGDTAVFRSEGSGNWRCISYQKASGASVVASGAIVNEGRLTLATGTPVTTTDQTAKTTVYWTPYFGKNISIYSGSNWITFSQAELSVSVPANASTPFDIFINYNSGTPALVATAWTNDTTRATALTTQDGVLVKSGTTTQRYLGTGRTTTVSGQTEDSVLKRYLWNYYNRVSRPMYAVDTTNNWTYTTDTYRQANANAANQIDFVVGYSEDVVRAAVQVACISSVGSVAAAPGIGVNSTSTNSAQVFTAVDASSSVQNGLALYVGIPSVGRTYLAWLEKCTASGTTTWYGDAGGTSRQAGIIGEVMA